MHVGDEDVVGLERRDGGVLVSRHADLEGIPQRRALERLDLAGHGGGEEERPALAGQELEDLLENRTEVHVEETIGFVHDQVLHAPQAEALGLLQVIEQPTGSRNDNMGLLSESNRLRNHVHTTQNQSAS